MFDFEELNEKTREKMLQEFEAKEGGNPFRSPRLSPFGVQEFPSIMREVINSGNEQTLLDRLNRPEYWNPTELYTRAGVTRIRRLNYTNAVSTFAVTEFNTWYVRGFARRLLDEGVTTCEVYRAASANEPREECREHEGARYPVQEIYNGHRARYWPTDEKPSAFSIPVGVHCHHIIRRVRTVE